LTIHRGFSPGPWHGLEPYDTGATVVGVGVILVAVVAEGQGNGRGGRFLVLVGEVRLARVVSQRGADADEGEREDEELEECFHG